MTCYARGNGTVFQCCLEYLDASSRYAPSLRAWIEAFPREQLHVLQARPLPAPGCSGLATASRERSHTDTAAATLPPTRCCTHAAPMRLQYENLTSVSQTDALRDLERFLQLAPGGTPDSLGLHNARHQKQKVRRRAGLRGAQGTLAQRRHCGTASSVSQRAGWHAPAVITLMPHAVLTLPTPPWLQTDGWPMRRSQYEQLVGLARRNAQE